MSASTTNARSVFRSLVLLMGVFVPSVVLAAETLRTTGVQDAIANRLSFDPAIDASAIKISSNNGNVRLTGSVRNHLARQRASEHAAIVRGVDTVENRLKIPKSEQSAAQLISDVRDALANHPATQSFRPEIRVSDGIVKLTGTVDSLAAAHLIESIVSAVMGVQDLEAALVIRLSAKVADYELQGQVEQALRWDTRVRADRIRCSVENGVVQLSGEVNSLLEKWHAITCASVAGAVRVESDDLSVVAVEGPFEVNPAPSADAVVAALGQALLRDPLVSITDFSARIEKGQLTLFGVTDSLFAAERAATLARYTHGVGAVRNELRVDPETRDDEELANALLRSFARDPCLDEAGITVAVQGGEATLSGQVENQSIALRASECAAGTAGLRAIHNHLETRLPLHEHSSGQVVAQGAERPSARAADNRIFSTIEEALWWSPFVDPSGIAIQVEAGVAVFRGSVASLAEAEAAVEAGYIAGARDVVNQLKIPVN